MRIRSSILFTLFGFCMQTAQALDLSTTTAPAHLSDNAITIGGRTLQLPAGEWVLVTEQKGSLTLDGLPNSVISTVYLALLKEKQLLASVILTLPHTSVSSGERLTWNGDRCSQAKGYLYREDFDSGWRTPACLLVYDRTDHLREQSPLMASARQWIKDEGIGTRAPYYHVSYSKNGERDYGAIHVLFPMRSVAFSADVGNWADRLHEALPRFFERRDVQASMPELPFAP